MCMSTVREYVVMLDDIKGPIIRWHDYGYEGWKPTSFKTVKDAMIGLDRGDIITRCVEFEIVEKQVDE